MKTSDFFRHSQKALFFFGFVFLLSSCEKETIAPQTTENVSVARTAQVVSNIENQEEKIHDGLLVAKPHPKTSTPKTDGDLEPGQVRKVISHSTK